MPEAKKYADEDGLPVGECPVTKRIRPLGDGGVCFEAYWAAAHANGARDPMAVHEDWQTGKHSHDDFARRAVTTPAKDQ